jgi:lysophospholipase L1-like esterase
MKRRDPRSYWTRAAIALSSVVGVLLVAQGPLLAQDTERPIDPARFSDAIAAFEAEDQADPPPPGAIVATGSSSIRRWQSIKEDLAPLTVIPRGFGGSTMADLLHYVDRIVIPYEPRAVVIYEGDNDTGSFFVAPQKVVDQFGMIVEKIHAALPETRVYVLSVKPSVLREAYWGSATEANELLQKMVADNDLLTYIDVATPFLQPDGAVMTDIFIEDGLHLNEKGTKIWGETIKAALLAGGEATHEPTSN